MGRQYRETYAAVAQFVPDGVSVVDVFCGTARLERDFLPARGIRYRGLDATLRADSGLAAERRERALLSSSLATGSVGIVQILGRHP